jgi:hypothetical protein
MHVDLSCPDKERCKSGLSEYSGLDYREVLYMDYCTYSTLVMGGLVGAFPIGDPSP